VPNQEIVIQFAANEVTHIDAEEAVAIIKKQLSSIGVNQVHVHISNDGILKIAYHSERTILDIQALLAQNNTFAFGYAAYAPVGKDTDYPFTEHFKNIQVDVYEIQQGNPIASDLNGFTFEIETKSNRYYTPVVTSFCQARVAKDLSAAQKIAYTCFKKVQLELELNTYEIPQVRAGPLLRI
jgi:hypothetical protein